MDSWLAMMMAMKGVVDFWLNDNRLHDHVTLVCFNTYRPFVRLGLDLSLSAVLKVRCVVLSVAVRDMHHN